MKYSADHIKRALERKGYKFFESGDYNVNIVGVRNSLTKNKVTNAFDDVMTLSYKKDGRSSADIMNLIVLQILEHTIWIVL